MAMGRRRTSPVNQLFAWVRKQSVKVKTALAVSTVLFLLVALKFLVRDHNYFFIASEFSHFIGIVVLIYKLSTQNSCAGNFLFIVSFLDRLCFRFSFGGFGIEILFLEMLSSPVSYLIVSSYMIFSVALFSFVIP